MNIEILDRAGRKAQARETLRSAQVSPKLFTALYLGLILLLNTVSLLATTNSGAASLLSTFADILTSLAGVVLSAGFVLYCMAIRRGERAEYLTLFDGFSIVGKVIGLTIVTSAFIFLWSMLFVIPGIIASYRYHFALFNLLENPDLSIMEALNMSKQQTLGYKSQLFMLDLSYIGWNLLAGLPAYLYVSYAANKVMMATVNGVGPEVFLETLMSLAVQSIVIFLAAAVWSLVVQLFYQPNYQCVQLDYFDAAKRTSGIDPLRSVSGTGFTGPDGLGGL